MRHELLATTQIYTELDPDELAALHAEASPIADLVARAGLAA
jgi:site-specific recombinase XerC